MLGVCLHACVLSIERICQIKTTETGYTVNRSLQANPSDAKPSHTT